MKHRRLRNIIQNKKGFTLVELMIYIALVAGILIAATSFAWSIINSRTKAFAIQEVEQNGRVIMERLTQEIHQATQITSPALGVGDSSLVLVMRDNQNDPTTFALDTNRIVMTQGGNPTLPLSSDQVIVTDLQFINYSTPNGKTNNVKIILQLDHLNPDNRQEWQATGDFTTTVELRDIY